MKKVGTMTFHSAYNYGAVLQAYALKENIKKLGYDAYVINYGDENQYPIFDLKNKDLSTICRNLQNIFYVPKIKRRNINFKKFVSDKLDLYPNKYINDEELKKVADDFYAIVAGSDQIWNNSNKMKDKSDTFFLNFDGNFKKISYAASFGDDADSIRKDSEKIVPWLKDFDAISIRENEGKELLNELGIDSVLTIDPTLLLDKNDWEKLEKRVNFKKNYILYYSVNSRKYSINVAKKVAKKMKLPVINLVLHPKSAFSGFKYIIDSAPDEFLNIIHNARFVCTNSFHGTVFSIIYDKPFIAIFDEKNGQIVLENRKATLLKSVGLEDHMITESMEIDIEKFLNYDYTETKKKLKVIREESINFLKKSLEGEKND